MSSRLIKVAVTQAEPVWYDLPATVKKTLHLIAEAASNGARLIAFPECWLPGHPLWIWSNPGDPDLGVNYIKNSPAVDSPEIAAVQACALDNKIAVSLGFSENENNSLYIAQLFIGEDGEIKVHRRKMKPSHMERTVFGDSLAHCLDSVGQLSFARVGGLNCWEHTQPLLKYNSMAQKEEIHVGAWAVNPPHTGGRDLWSTCLEGCHALSSVYAIESGTFVLHCTALISDAAVEKTGTASSLLQFNSGAGASAVFGPDGRRLTELTDPKEETILYADLDMDRILEVRMFADPTGHYSRPDLLWLGVDKTFKSVVREGSGAPEVGVIG
ncbi:Arylacetonitrilase [Fusarium oxysporum f. sp. matthiolae]|nr:Arylacetonitrilase [Fusarium oxysporum f. sp. matthiolae]